jgi:hypothetical protein
MAFPSCHTVSTASVWIAVGTASVRRRRLAREAVAAPADHMTVRRQPAAVQRVSNAMPISRLLQTACGKLRNARIASRQAAAHKAAAHDVAQKQMLMRQLTETLQANRGSEQK